MCRRLVCFCLETCQKLCRVRAGGNPCDITLISAYAPTLQSTEAEKDELYDRLGHVIRLVPRDGMLILMGNFNNVQRAKIGRDDALTHVTADKES